VKIALDYTPTARQALFHASNADEALYGGAAGGGKSKALVMEALLRCLEHPGTVAYLFRRSYGELEDTLVAEALASAPAQLCTYKASKHDMELVNGSVLRFRHCLNESDRFLYQGAEIHWLFIDEVTHFTKPMYDFLKSRLRAKASLGIRPIVRCAGNPGGLGHAWVRERFVDCGRAGEVHVERVHSEALGATEEHTIQYIPARATDNPYIGREYIFELERKPKALRDALLLGKWDAFEGQAFDEWRDEPDHYGDRRFTHVVEPFAIPEEWPRYRSFDFGYAKPFSVGWWACGPDGEVVRYREWYGAKGANVGLRLDAHSIAKGIRRAEEEHEAGLLVRGIADPSIWDASRGESIAEQMEREGVYFQPGDNARLAGKMQLHSRLRFDEEGRAGLMVFRTCRDFLRTVPALCADTVQVEDVDTRGEDHIYDETRYFLMERPVGPVTRKKKRAWNPLA
jgi:hypothetical protein